MKTVMEIMKLIGKGTANGIIWLAAILERGKK